mmetsp:Transcript_121535/g.355182  ORF Transcript_121535/g.355182 Transcript_121535/m.355182 type:complete len:953 (+) Transcript_121535:53-2911(+)
MGAQLGCNDDRKEEEGSPKPSGRRHYSKQAPGGGLTTPLVKASETACPPLVQPAVAGGNERRSSSGLPAQGQGTPELPAPVEVCVAAQEWGADEFPDGAEPDDEDDCDDDIIELSVASGSGEAAFRHNISLACRTAVCCLLCSMPIILPRWYKYMDPNYSAMITSGVVEMVVFTTFKNLGATIQLAWQGFVGTLAACCVTHVLNALMPGGAGGDYYFAPVVHLINILTIFTGLWLNISKNVRMFLLCWHAYFLMEFMNPNSTAVFNTSWAINLDAYTTTTLVTSTAGVLAAICVMLLPYPVTSRSACREAAAESVMQMTSLVGDLAAYYSRSEPSVKITQLEERSSDLRDMIKAMEADIESYWWETFDFGAAGRSRELLGRHLRMMTQAADTIYAMEVCISREDFAPTHVECMACIDPAVQHLVAAVARLLRCATYAASDGRLSDAEVKHLADLARRARAANAALARSFDATRRQLSPERPVTAVLMSEAFFAHCLSSYASMAVEYTENLLADPPRPVPCPVAMARAFRGIFDPAVLRRAKDVHSFTIRNTISLVICYYVGFYLLGYSGVAAGTAALLITDFLGSALHKNMMRLQAVCIGSVLPHLIARMLGQSCHPARIIMQGVCIFLWEVLTNYVYYSSPTWGYVGCLTGAFSTTVLVYPCVMHETEALEAAATFAFQSAAMQKMTETAIAAFVMTMVDMMLMSERASTMATQRLLESFLMLDAGFQSTLLQREPSGEPDVSKILNRASTRRLRDGSCVTDLMKLISKRAQGTILHQLSLAATFGEEADKEPRYHRVPWPMDFFCGLVHTGHVLRTNLNCLERTLQGGDGSYSDVFAQVRQLPEFGSIQLDLLNTSRDCITCVQKVLQNETGVEMPKLMDKMTSMEKVDTLEALPQLIDDINASGLAYPEKVAETLEDDPLCRLSVALMLLDSTVYHMAAMVKACIRQAT